MKVCGLKCTYCGTSFFKTERTLADHEKICRSRTDFPCEHCGKKFDSKSDLGAHLSAFCPKRHLSYNCPICSSSSDFNALDKLEVLEHMIRCKPTTDHPRYNCYICSKQINKGNIQLHMQHELLHSRLFDKEELAYPCSSCDLVLPTEKLLYLHIEMAHPCRTALSKRNEVLEDLKGIDMPSELRGEVTVFFLKKII